MKRLLAVLIVLFILFSPASASAESGESGAPEILSVFVQSGVVTLRASESAVSCCFTQGTTAPDADSPDWIALEDGGIHIFKMDGTYRVFVKNEHEQIGSPRTVTVVSSYNYLLDAEGLSVLDEPIEDYLSARGSSVDQINSYVAAHTATAGLQTRSGVATAAVSFATSLASLDLALPYQLYGTYQGEDDWGVNPAWGTRLGSPIIDDYGTYRVHGMHCVAIVVWAYKQAGINLVNNITGSIVGKNGSLRWEGDNAIAFNAGRGGDIVTAKSGHAMLILDRLDTDLDGAEDSYLVLEMINPSMTLHVHSFQSLRNYTVYDMSAVFSNTGRMMRASRFWSNTYFIPQSAWPDYLREAAAFQIKPGLFSGLPMQTKQ
jgi:hypothetical protein